MTGDGWEAVLSRATAAWTEDHEAGPTTFGEVRDFVEAYLKPVFVAQAAGVDRGGRAEELNLSALGRRLDIGDGTTVKKFVERYRKRFAGG